MTWKIENFPPKQDLETRKVLKKATLAHRYLAELKGLARSIPNQGILINTLALQEAKDSSEIENIVTTHSDLFRAERSHDDQTPALKEVYRYSSALLEGFRRIKQNKIMTLNQVIEVHTNLTGSHMGFRKQSGTELKNDRTGETVYVPPQNPNEIAALLSDLESYINSTTKDGLDPLIKMALIHHQYESIHPFTDGNGRSGRIINMLYLVLQELIDIPILYLSRYITSTKSEYYALLQSVRDNETWEEWVIYILDGVAITAQHSLELVQNIKSQMQNTKEKIRKDLPKIYSQDLLNSIYRHPYTRIQNIIEDLEVTRPTATRYLEKLTEHRILTKEKHGRDLYYINAPLAGLFFEMPSLDVDI